MVSWKISRSLQEGKTKRNYSAAPIFVRSGRLMYRIVHYGDQPERTWALLNSYGSEFTHILRGTLHSHNETKCTYPDRYILLFK